MRSASSCSSSEVSDLASLPSTEPALVWLEFDDRKTLNDIYGKAF